MVLFPGVTLRSLNLLKWKTADGQKQKLSVLETVMNSWKRIGHCLGVSNPLLQAWEKKYLRDPEECCRCVFQHWIDNGCEDYEVSWDGVVELLDDLNFSEDVIKLQEALKNQ